MTQSNLVHATNDTTTAPSRRNPLHVCCRVSDCPVCYNVVQQHVTELRQSIYNLRIIIENIGQHPETIDDTDFRRQLTVVNRTVVRLWQDARRLSGNFISGVPQRIAISP